MIFFCVKRKNGQRILASKYMRRGRKEKITTYWNVANGKKTTPKYCRTPNGITEKESTDITIRWQYTFLGMNCNAVCGYTHTHTHH